MSSVLLLGPVRWRFAVAILSVAALAVTSPTASAASKRPFKSCASLNKVYPHGVGRPGAVDQTEGEKVRNFRVDAALYKLVGPSLDRDRDGIACEQL